MLASALFTLARTQINIHQQKEREVAQSYLTLCDPMDCGWPYSSVHGFSRQEYWSGLPLPSPGIFPIQGSNRGLPHCRQTLSSEPPGKPPSTEEWIKKTWYIWTYNEILFSHKKEQNNAICSNMDVPRDSHIEWSQSDKDKYHMTQLRCGVLKKATNELSYKTETELKT